MKWIIIDGLLFAASGVFFFVPGPNLVAYYFGFRLVGHYLSRRGAKHGLTEVRWQSCAQPAVVAPAPRARARAARARARSARGRVGAAAAASGEILRANLGEDRVIFSMRCERCRAKGPRNSSDYELAERLGCRLEGDGALEIRRVAGLEQAGEGDLSFFANPRYAPALRRTRASAVIIGESAPAAPARCFARNIHSSRFANALSLFVTPTHPPSGIDTLSAIAADATLGRDVSIGPFSSVGRGARVGDRTIVYPNVFIGDGAVVGDDCVIHSHAAIRERVIVGNRVIIQNGAVIGADGYGFVKRPDGTHQKIPQTADRRPRRRRRDRRQHHRSIGRRLARRAFRPARRSTISCRSATA